MTTDAAIPLTDNARTVLATRYLRRSSNGDPIESPEDLFRRVADDVGSAERVWGADPSPWQQAFFEEMAALRFLPNSPTLMNAGRDLQQLAACFVLPIEDSLDSIFDALKLTAKIHQSGGGTGFSFSHLRPRGDEVKTTGGVASGAVSFLEVYDAATERIKQGSFRRGANMGILSVDHPDILEFIDAKRHGSISNFNISVAVTEEWMTRASAGAPYDLVNPRSGEVVAQLNAGMVIDRIAEAAWATGDPGLVFIDRMNAPRTNPTPHLGRIEATNPCGEQPLLPYEACVLGSINLARFAAADGIAWDPLAATIGVAVRFLDNAVERTRYPVPEIEHLHKEGNRKIGLGVMGWADLLIRLGVPYDDPEAVTIAEELMSFVSGQADDASAGLAAERGSFPNWEASIYGPGGENRAMRNATRTTVAPTGTISIIAGCSSGIEPLFALSYYRRALDGALLLESNAAFAAAAQEHGFGSPEVMERITSRGGVQGMPEVPKEIQRLYATAHEIDPEWHLRHQGAFQRHVDSAVSKTINLPNSATSADIRNILLRARDLGCHGITVYRDGSKRWQVLNQGRPAGTDLGTVEGSAPTATEDRHVLPPSRGANVLEVCPVCGSAAFEFAEACGKCHACGHSIC